MNLQDLFKMILKRRSKKKLTTDNRPVLKANKMNTLVESDKKSISTDNMPVLTANKGRLTAKKKGRLTPTRERLIKFLSNNK